MSYADILRRFPLFSDLDERELGAMQTVLKRHDVEPGATLVEEGGRRTGCYVVVMGKLGVYKKFSEGNEERLAEIGPGRLAGHVSLMDGFPRAMSFRAEANKAVVVELPHTEFDMIMGQARSQVAFKLLARMTEDAAELLRQVNKRVSELGPPKGAEDAEQAKS